ncbi:MAG: CoA-binding protein [Ginsengibacter sp.]
MSSKKTLVLGASANPARYSYLAINMLREKGHDVVAIGKHTGKVNEVEVHSDQEPIENLDTVTLYLNANNQKAYYDYIFSLNPKRIIFNPGAENQELAALAKQKNIFAQQACTLVLLSTGQY